MEKNPFSFEKDNKKVLDALERFNIQQSESKELGREARLAGVKTSSMAARIKEIQAQARRRGSQQLGRGRSMSHENLALHQFVNQKREIIYSKFKINTRKEAIQHIQARASSKTLSLLVQKSNFREDCKEVQNLLQETRLTLEKAKVDVYSLKKAEHSLIEEEHRLNNQLERIDNVIYRQEVEYKKLQSYKAFLQSVTPKGAVLALEAAESPFLTQNKTTCVFFLPQSLIQLLNEAVERNLYLIYSIYQAKDEVEKAKKELDERRRQAENRTSDYRQKKRGCEQLIEAARLKREELLASRPQQQIFEMEGQELNMGQIGEWIAQTHRQMFGKIAGYVGSSSQELKNLMRDIESKILSLTRESEINEVKLMQLVMKARHIKERVSNMGSQVTRERTRGKSDIPAVRKAVARLFLQKRVKMVELKESANVDDQQQYFM